MSIFLYLIFRRQFAEKQEYDIFPLLMWSISRSDEFILDLYVYLSDFNCVHYFQCNGIYFLS